MVQKSSFPRWLAVASGLAIVAVVTGGAAFYHTQEVNLRHQAETELQVIARLKSDQIAAWRQEQLADAAVLMESPFLGEQVVRLMASPHADNTKEMLTRFRSLQEHYHYFDVLLVDADGQVRLRVGGSHVPLCPAVAQSVAEALRERRPVLTDINAGTDELPPHISVIAPIFAKSGAAGEQVGAIILLTNTHQFLCPLVESWPTPSRSAEALLVRRDGDSVLFLNEPRHRKHSALALRIPLSREDVPAVMAVRGQVGVVRGKDYRGVEVLSALQAVPDSPWFMVAKVDSEEVFAASRFRSILILALALLLVLLAVVVAGFIWQRNDRVHYQSLVRAQAELRESEENLSATLRSIGDAVIATDTDGRVVRMNPVAEELTGWPLAEAAGRPLAEVFHIIDARTREPAADPVKKAMESGQIVGMTNDTSLIARDGTEHKIADSAAPIRRTEGSIRGAVLVFHDVTAQYEIREALRVSEIKYRTLVEHLPHKVFTKDHNSVYVSCNEPYARDLGIPGAEIAGKTDFDFFPPDLAEKYRADDQRIMQMGGTEEIEEDYIEHGEQRTVWTAKTPVRDDQGNVIGVLGIFTDITERKRAERKLLELKAVVEQAADGIAAANLDGHITFANGAWAKMHGYSVDELIGRHLGIFHTDEQLQNDVTPFNKQVMEHGSSESEVGHVRKDGTTFPTWMSAAVLLDASQKPIGIIGMARDITERKRAEEALRESEERLRLAINATEDGIWEWDIQTNREFFSPRWCEIIGYSSDDPELPHTYDSWASRIHPDDYSRVISAMRDHLEKGTRYDVEYRHLHKSGEYRWQDSKGQTVLDESGKPTKMVGAISDITERKRAEEALRESQDKFRSLFEGSRDAVMTLEPPCWEFTSCNQATLEMFLAKDVEEFTSLAPWEVSPELQPDGRASADKAKEMIETAVREGSHFFEWTHTRISGEEFPATVLLSRVEQGGKTFLQATVRDITEGKQAEEALAQAKAELEAVNHQLVDALRQANELASQMEQAKDQIEEKAVELGHQAAHDSLTGLANRQSFEAHLRERTKLADGARPRSFTVLFVDLDKFKMINDTLGHEVGDLLLVEVGVRLQSCLRSEDVLARMGGDEYTIMLPRLHRRSFAESVASRIIDSISRPFEIEGHRFVIGASIGIAAYPADGTNATDLLTHADSAMYKAKEAGRDTRGHRNRSSLCTRERPIQGTLPADYQP